jgi:hypothetical protein
MAVAGIHPKGTQDRFPIENVGDDDQGDEFPITTVGKDKSLSVIPAVCEPAPAVVGRGGDPSEKNLTDP